MTTYVGIDPGLDGAVAILGDAPVQIHETPVLGVKGEKRQYNTPAMVAMLKNLVGPARVIIEQVHAMPKQGVSSSFTFGKGYGIWLGILAALEFPHVLVTPERWKKTVLDGAPKTDAGVAAVATRLYPAAAPLLVGARGGLRMGPIDALLIAHYGVRSGS